MQTILQYFRDFSHLIFPFNCYGCGIALDQEEETVCKLCKNDLPLTKYWMRDDNPVAQLFWGKIKVEQAAALAFFRKGNKVQALMHELKYKGKTEVGELLGEWLGEQLVNSKFDQVDTIVPVPLHAQKRKKRGYNQCDPIALGLGRAMGKDVQMQGIVRLKYNESQTKKGVYDRWLNVKELFRVETPEEFEGKHVLLIDDVVTTGSTLEACAGAILNVPRTKVSIAALGCPAPY